MAYLNVRDRRVETTIAYVGPLGAGKATNLQQLGHRSGRGEALRRDGEQGEALVLDWTATATAHGHFPDCSVSVKLVAPKGPSPERIRKLVQEVDGIVLVLGAEPTSTTENRRFVELLREAVASSTRPNVPVLVQVNKTDLPDALGAEALAKELGAEWPHLSATATSGDGVVATLEEIVERVLVALRDPPEAAVPGSDRTTTSGPRAESNPLLGALKQVLRETVRAHVAELGEAFAERLARSTASTLELQEKTVTELAALRLALVDESARTRATLATLQDEVAALRQSTNELRLRVTTGAEETVRGLVATSTALSSCGERLTELEGKSPDPAVFAEWSRDISSLGERLSTQGTRIDQLVAMREDERSLEALTDLSSRTDALVATIASQGTALAALEARASDTGPWDRIGSRLDQLATSLTALEKKAVTPLGGEIAKMRAEARKGIEDLTTHIPRANEELRADLLRALDVRSRTDRDHTTTTVSALQASMTLLSDAVDRADGSGRLAEIATTLEGVRSDLGTLRGLDEMVKDSSRRADERASVASTTDARTELSLEDIRTRLSELQSELKKKKSWFT